jgi:hypothetical protein
MFYTDPGSGLLVLQLLTSGVAAAGFYFREKIAALSHYFKRGSAARESSNERRLN